MRPCQQRTAGKLLKACAWLQKYCSVRNGFMVSDFSIYPRPDSAKQNEAAQIRGGLTTEIFLAA
jgi:hypothetical protein